ncbi:MAG: methylenetetrahydrofolate reductase [NAD(P)H] [Planctomycetota bacterium]
MKVRDVFQQQARTFSFEFFPPKTDEAAQALFEHIDRLKQLAPSFVSVTYGAGGSTRERTRHLVMRIQNEVGLNAVAHLTCVNATRAELVEVIREYGRHGVENLLALRGDPPKGSENFRPTDGGLAHADELVGLIRETGDFSIGVAGYPEGHPETRDLQRDLENLKRKTDRGADYVVTQLFFDPVDFFAFVERARKIGIKQRILPGIMPILSVAGVKRMTSLCGAKIPAELARRLAEFENDPDAIRRIGVAWATTMCDRLLQGGADGLHFYTLNQSTTTEEIYLNLGARTSAHLSAVKPQI